MAGLDGRTQMVKGLQGFVQDTKKSYTKGVDVAALDAAIAGEWTMHNVIATFPSAFVEGKDNRIWTGHMYRAADSDVKRIGTKVTASVGWLKYQEKYFLSQERLPPKNTNGEGMHAILAAQERMKHELDKKGIR